jgi:hypothetical protein
MAYINAPHPGHGLVLNIHLSNVGAHALSLSHSGGVDASRMVERMAPRRLAAERSMTTPFSWSPLAYRGALNIGLDGWLSSDRERSMARRSNTQVLIHS